jgi:hypothetical protein
MRLQHELLLGLSCLYGYQLLSFIIIIVDEHRLGDNRY